jgi:hypothetical protein
MKLSNSEARLDGVCGINGEIVVSVAGQEIRQRTANGTLRIDPGPE